jgi:protein-S-isoprenylcysteine O-methyltransferase Ste14
MIWRLLPLIGVLLMTGLACCWRPWMQFRRHGTWGVLLFRSGRPGQTLRDGLLVTLFVLLLGQAILAAGWPQALATLHEDDSATTTLLRRVTGAVLMLGGIALLVMAQLHLGVSWRIGIDEGAAPGLVTEGLYRLTRNPIYLGLLVTIAGYALLLPTMLSGALLLGTWTGARRQVAVEEAYLLRTYGETYRSYAGRVGRRNWPVAVIVEMRGSRPASTLASVIF